MLSPSPPLWRSQRARTVSPQRFLWRGRTPSQLELADFHPLSHVGGEVIGENTGARGSRRWKRFRTAAVGKAVGNPQEPKASSRGAGAGGCSGPPVFSELTLQSIVMSVLTFRAQRQKQEVGRVARAEVGQMSHGGQGGQEWPREPRKDRWSRGKAWGEAHREGWEAGKQSPSEEVPSIGTHGEGGGGTVGGQVQGLGGKEPHDCQVQGVMMEGA